jgi:hypothetical protein
LSELLINRTNGLGQPISLTQWPSTNRTVLYTGAPGMGTSTELTHAERSFRAAGHEVFRLDASPARDEPIVERLARSVAQDWRGVKSRNPGQRQGIRRLRRAVRDLVPTAFETKWWQRVFDKTEIRTPATPLLPQGVKKLENDNNMYLWRMDDLADRLGELARARGKQVVFLIDNLDAASKDDLVAFNDLAVHLSQQADCNVQVVGAGSDRTLSRLMDASRGPDGIPSRIPESYDVRHCRPAADDQLMSMVVSTANRTGIRFDDRRTADALIAAANGNPGKLSQLHDVAMRTAVSRSVNTWQQTQPMVFPAPPPQPRIDASVLHDAMREVQMRNAEFYTSQILDFSSDADRDLLRTVAQRGRDGLPARGRTDIDYQRRQLVTRGILRESDQGVLTFADPLMLDHFREREGIGPNLTVLPPTGQRAVPGRPQPAQLSPAERQVLKAVADRGNRGLGGEFLSRQRAAMGAGDFDQATASLKQRGLLAESQGRFRLVPPAPAVRRQTGPARPSLGR